MWKFTRDEKRWQNPGFHQNPNFQRAELFLDFDPVAPEWPGEQSTEPQLEEESAPPVGVVVTAEDFRRLKLMIRAVRGRTRFGEYPNVLERKLRQAQIMQPAQISSDIVTMNSTVRVFDAMTGEHSPFTIVYPQHEAHDPRAVSVLSSLGTAVLGHRAGEVVGTSTNKRRFTIEKVLYQPEAEGDLHL